MKIVVCGSRDWTDSEKVLNRLARLTSMHTVIITGGARGADTVAHEAAKKLAMETLVIPADWARMGKSAGPVRNRAMLDQNPDLVIAFHHELSKSKGTIDCILEANRRGITVEVIP